MKRCCGCKTAKNLDDFGKNSSKSDGLQDSCRECRAARYQDNKAVLQAKSRKWHADNRESSRNYSNKWRDSNPDRVREYKRDWNRKRYHSDPAFRLKSVIRARLNKHLKSLKEGRKAGSPVRDLGCSIAELISYVEAKFALGMSWDNHGTVWELDHIEPLASFDLTNRTQFLRACCYKNLQPLTIGEHLEKTNREAGRKCNLIGQ